MVDGSLGNVETLLPQHVSLARLQSRLLNSGSDDLTDDEMLELVLQPTLHKSRINLVVGALIAHFGSFAGCISATSQDLLEIEGVGDAEAAALKIAQAAALRLLRAEVINTPVLGNWKRLMDYLNGMMARERVEQFRILFLNSKNCLLADEVQGRGTINHTPVYPREVIKRAFELNATALILVHNHPSGDPWPSDDDIRMTREILTVGKCLAIAVHDHVIIGNGRWMSLRREGLLD